MKVNDLKKFKKDLDEKFKIFDSNKLKFNEMIKNAKKNGDNIGCICNDLLIYINAFECGKIDRLDTDYITSEIFKIQDIVWGKHNDKL